MSVYQMALTTLCEFAVCVLLIIGYIKQDKLIRFERGFIRVAAVYVAVIKAWRKERERLELENARLMCKVEHYKRERREAMNKYADAANEAQRLKGEKQICGYISGQSRDCGR